MKPDFDREREARVQPDGRAGTVMLEFVLAFPLILTLMLGCMQFAHIWMAKQVVHYSAFCAARAALVCHDGERKAAAQQAAEQVCAATDIDESTRVRDLTDAEVTRIRNYIEESLKVEGDLRREVNQNIKRKMEIGSYQGLRHRRGLPVRGQRTHTNARTRKGPKKTVAGKKKVRK